MPRTNVELHRSLVEAFNAHDPDAFAAHFDSSGEFESVFAEIGGYVYRGRDELRRYFRDLREAWGDDLHLEPELYFEHDEHTLLYHLIHARGRQSGAGVTRSATHLCRWRGGLLIHMKTYALRDEALRRLGVAEGELTPIAP